MGSQHSSVAGEASSGSGNNTPRRGSQRGSVSNSGSEETTEKPQPTSLVPIEKLGKFLVQHCSKEENVNGITENSLIKYVFPGHTSLARSLHRQMRAQARNKAGPHVTLATFRAYCERLLGLLDDVAVIEIYVRMFSEEEATMTGSELWLLLHVTYTICAQHAATPVRMCLDLNETLQTVVGGCFGNKQSHSAGFVVRWIDEHLPRVIQPLHRYVVHSLTTRYRSLPTPPEPPTNPQPPPEPPAEPRASTEPRQSPRLSCSMCWLLAAALPPMYCAVPVIKRQGSHDLAAPPPALAWSPGGLPTHWACLYSAAEHGLAANRLLHHVTAYRGATIMLLVSREVTIAVCSDTEWKESHQYWGQLGCCLVELAPVFSVLERGPKMLYLNTSIRGYVKGLRVGTDVKTPILDVSDGFDSFKLRGQKHELIDIEVWGCGDAASREVQLDIKKWQVREAERQRQVKLSSADWIEHPDRYLLELAGRPQYNNSAK